MHISSFSSPADLRSLKNFGIERELQFENILYVE